jgi:hypothetical protein
VPSRPYESVRRANNPEKPQRTCKKFIADVPRDAAQARPDDIVQVTKSPSHQVSKRRCDATANSYIPAIEFWFPCLSSGAGMHAGQHRTLQRALEAARESVLAAWLLCDELSSSPATSHTRAYCKPPELASFSAAITIN